jgi:rhodanese-related sulfurtransferase
MSDLKQSAFRQLHHLEQEVARLEGKLLEMEHKMQRLLQIERNHLIRIKNQEEVSDDFLQYGRTYNDLTPEKAWKHYINPDFDFILLDVSSEDFTPAQKLNEAIHIPWSQLPERFMEISSKTTPIMVISEDGTNSVLACELLVKRGYFNCSNISGGYKFWKGFRLQELQGESA